MTARGKPVATEGIQVLWEFSESKSWSVHEDEVTGKPVAYKDSAGKTDFQYVRKFKES